MYTKLRDASNSKQEDIAVQQIATIEEIREYS